MSQLEWTPWSPEMLDTYPRLILLKLHRGCLCTYLVSEMMFLGQLLMIRRERLAGEGIIPAKQISNFLGPSVP